MKNKYNFMPFGYDFDRFNFFQFKTFESITNTRLEKIVEDFGDKNEGNFTINDIAIEYTYMLLDIIPLTVFTQFEITKEGNQINIFVCSEYNDGINLFYDLPDIDKGLIRYQTRDLFDRVSVAVKYYEFVENDFFDPNEEWGTI